MQRLSDGGMVVGSLLRPCFLAQSAPGMPGILTFLGYRAFDRFLVGTCCRANLSNRNRPTDFSDFPRISRGVVYRGEGQKILILTLAKDI